MSAGRFLGAVTIGALLGLGAGYYWGGSKVQVPETKKVKYVVKDSINCEPDFEVTPDLKVKFGQWKDCDSQTLWREVVSAYKMHGASNNDISNKVRDVARANKLTAKHDIIRMIPNAEGCKDTTLGSDTLPEVPAGKEMVFPHTGKKVDKGCKAVYDTVMVDVPTGAYRTESTGGFPWWYPLLGALAGGIGYLFGRGGRRDRDTPEPPRGEGEAPGRRFVPEEAAEQPAGAAPADERREDAGAHVARTDLGLAEAPRAGDDTARNPNPEDEGPGLAGGRGRRTRRGETVARGPETPQGGGTEGAQSYFSDSTVDTLLAGYASYRAGGRVKAADVEGKAVAYKAFKDRGATRKAGGKDIFDRKVASYLDLDNEVVNAYRTKSAEQVAAEYKSKGVDISASTIRRLAKEELGEIGYKALMKEKRRHRKLAYPGAAEINDRRAAVLPYRTETAA